MRSDLQDSNPYYPIMGSFPRQNCSYCQVSQNESLMSWVLNDHNRFYCETDSKYDYDFLEEVPAHLRLTDRVERYTKVGSTIVASHSAHNAGMSKASVI